MKTLEQIKQEKENRSPEAFKDPLRKSLYSRKIKEVGKKKDKVIRPFGLELPNYKKNYEKAIEFATKSLSRFDKLRDTYNIPVLEPELVIAEDERGQIDLFGLVDRVEGSNLDDVETLPAEARDKADEFFSSLTTYYRDVYSEGGYYWRDF